MTTPTPTKELRAAGASVVPTTRPTREGHWPKQPGPLYWLSQARPLHVGAIALVVAVIYVLARIFVAGSGNVGALVLLGHTFVHPSHATAAIPVRAGTGYDGQFYFRMALAPSNWSRQAFGIRLDSMGRLSRIGYPALVWLISWGNSGNVPVAMLAVNIVAFGALAAAAAALAGQAGRSPIWGLSLASFAGFLWSMGRDLTEVTEAAFFVTALLLLRKGRPVLAGLALASAVLTREPAIILAFALVLVRGVWALRPVPAEGGPWRRLVGQRPAWAASPSGDAAWALPLAAFAAWQLTVWAGTGTVPILSSTGSNIGVPFVALAKALMHYARAPLHVASLLWLSELSVLTALTIGAALAIWGGSLVAHESFTWIALLAMSLCLGNGVWVGDVGFRSLDDLWAMGCMALLGSRWSLRWPACVAGAMWAVVVVELVRFL